MAKNTKQKKQLFETVTHKVDNVEYIVSDKSVIIKTGYIRISYLLGTWQYNMWSALIKNGMRSTKVDVDTLRVYTNALLSTSMNILDRNFVENLSKIFKDMEQSTNNKTQEEQV